MESGVKAAIGATVVVVLAVGVRVGLIYRERNAPVNVKAPERERIAEDDLVYLRQKRPTSLADVKELVGPPVWVSGGGHLAFSPYGGRSANYGKGAGVRRGAERMGGEGLPLRVPPECAPYWD